MAEAQEIEFEIAFVGKAKSFLRRLKAPAGASIKDALTIACEADNDLLGDAGAHVDVAIYGERAHDLSRPLRPGERLEILRPLVMSPADARRVRAMKP